MATNCYLARKIGSKYEVIYNHFDGYPRRMIPLLNEFYSDKEIVERLFSLGDVSFLDETLESSNFYGRDRNEQNTRSRLVDEEELSYMTTYEYDAENRKWTMREK